MNEENVKKKRKRIKIKCLVCKSTFNDDYRSEHNRKIPADYMKSRTCIPYEEVGAPQHKSFFSPAAPTTSTATRPEEVLILLFFHFTFYIFSHHPS